MRNTTPTLTQRPSTVPTGMSSTETTGNVNQLMKAALTLKESSTNDNLLLLKPIDDPTLPLEQRIHLNIVEDATKVRQEAMNIGFELDILLVQWEKHRKRIGGGLHLLSGILCMPEIDCRVHTPKSLGYVQGIMNKKHA